MPLPAPTHPQPSFTQSQGQPALLREKRAWEVRKLPVGTLHTTGPGSERSWGGREEVSQLPAQMGMGGRSPPN